MKTIKILFVAIIGSLLSVSCLVDDEAPQQEFTQTPYAVGFKNVTQNSALFTTGDIEEIKVIVDVLGGMNNTSLPSQTIGFEIDPSSTAVLGTDYELVETGGSLLINEGADFGEITLKVNTGNIATGNTPSTVVINLLSNSAGIISGAKQQVTVNIFGLCVSSMEGTYDNADVPTDVATVTALGNGAYSCSGLPFLGFSGGTVPIEFEFLDVCDEITITSFELSDSYLIEGSGLNNGDGTFTFTYVIYNDTTNTSGLFFDYSDSPSTYTIQ